MAAPRPLGKRLFTLVVGNLFVLIVMPLMAAAAVSYMNELQDCQLRCALRGLSMEEQLDICREMIVWQSDASAGASTVSPTAGKHPGASSDT